MAIVGHANHRTPASLTNAVSYTPVSAGNSLVAVVYTGLTPGSLTVTDTAGNDWATIVAPAGGGGGYLCAAYAKKILGGANTITCTLGNSLVSTVEVVECTGTGDFDTSSTVKTATSQAFSTNSATPAVANEIALAFVGVSGVTTTSAWANSYVLEDAYKANTPSLAVADSTVSAATSTSGAISGGANLSWAAMVLLFRSSSAITVLSSVPASITNNSGTYTLSEPVAVNDALLVQWSADNASSAIVPAITDTLGAAYLLAGSPTYYAAGSKSWGQSWAACIKAGTPTLTVSSALMSNAQLIVTHITGFSTPPLLGAFAQTSGSGTAISNSLAVGAGNSITLATTFSPSTIASTPADWASTNSGGNGSVNQIYTQSTTAAATLNFNATLSASSTYTSWLLNFYSVTAADPLLSGRSGPGISPDKRAMFHSRRLSYLPVVLPLRGRALTQATVLGALTSLGAGNRIGYFPQPGPGLDRNPYLQFFRRPLAASALRPNVAGSAVATAVARGSLAGSTALFARALAGVIARGNLTIIASRADTLYRGPGISADWPQSFLARRLADSPLSAVRVSIAGLAVSGGIAIARLGGGNALTGVATALGLARGNLPARGAMAGTSLAGAIALANATAAQLGALQGLALASVVNARAPLRSFGPFPGPSRFIPPGLGSPVSYRQFSWLELVAQAWGSEFRQPDQVYQFSGGRRFDSTDQNRGSFYGAVPSVVAPTLAGFASGFTVYLSWTPATIDGSSITGYTLWRSANGANALLHAVLQASSDAYADMDLAPGSYTYFLLAEAATGAVSPESNSISVSI